jgi:hypothetical protein
MPKPEVYCGTPHGSVYSGLERPWPTEAWRTIVAEGTVSHFAVAYRRLAPFLGRGRLRPRGRVISRRTKDLYGVEGIT